MGSRRLVTILVGLIGLLVVAFVVFAFVLAGRGSTGASPQSGGQSAGVGAPASGELRLIGADPPTLDPAVSEDADSATYIVEIFSGLVTYEVGSDNRMSIVPDLAEKWDISQDGRTYTFTLRAGAKFHSGKPVTAQDFKYSIERALKPATLSTTADTYLGDIVGAQDMLAGRATSASGIEAVDDRTLRITIDASKPYFLAKLTYPTAFVVDRANVESGRTWTSRPNGTGPFKLTEWQLGQRIVLEQNPDYYRGPPKLQKATFLLAAGASMTMFENNEIDVTGVSAFDIDRVSDPSNPLSKQLITCPGETLGCPNYDIFYVAFNTRSAPFDDINVRRAFVQSVNVEQIANVVLRGLYDPAKGILPQGFPGYNPNVKPLAFNPDAAKAALAASRYGSAAGLPRIVLTLPGGGATAPGSIEAVLEQWRTNLGVDVQVQQVEFATFLSQLNRGAYGLFSLGWIADYIDPHDFLDILFYSKSNQNHPGYKNETVDRLLEQARTERDDATRISLYQQVEQAILDDAAWLPLWHTKSYILVSPQVKGFKVLPFVFPMLKDVSIER
jgi:oligopeptide transport system substrate-binding protein